MRKPCVLITRPETDAKRLADMLAVRGYTSVIEPILRIRFFPEANEHIAKAITKKTSAIIVSSRYALIPLSNCPAAKNLPLFVVGDATATEAEDQGFTHVISGGKDAAGLCSLISTQSAFKGRMLYVRAMDVKFDMPACLAPAGIKVDEAIVYTAEPITSFSTAGADALANAQIDAATFFSARTAEHFLNLAARQGVMATLSAIPAFCLSQAVANSANHNIWRECVVSEHPTLTSLVESMDKALHAG